MKGLLLRMLDSRLLGTALHHVFGRSLRADEKILGFTNPFLARNLVVDRDGSRYVAPLDSYLVARSPERQLVRFDGGAYEPEISYLIRLLVSPDDTVVDIGANVGLHTVAMAKAAHRGHVHAFEPVAEMAEKNSINCALNNLRNVSLWQCGLGKSDGELTMNVNVAGAGLEGTSSFMETDHIAARPDHYQARRVPVRRLDDVMAQIKPSGRIALIKIDTEGSEPSVLEGAIEVIRTHRPAMIVEAHSTRLRAVGKNFRWYLDTFPNHHIFTIPSITSANPWFRLDPLISEPDEVCVNLLLLPRNAALTSSSP